MLKPQAQVKIIAGLFLPTKDDGVILLVLGIFGLGIVSYAIAQSNVNKLV